MEVKKLIFFKLTSNQRRSKINKNKIKFMKNYFENPNIWFILFIPIES